MTIPTNEITPEEFERRATGFRETFQRMEGEMSKLIVGHGNIVRGILMGLVAQGNVLLEGVPGIGKTMLVRTLAQVIDVDFSRIQFTPDLMPADILGTQTVSEDERGHRVFGFQKGPIFANVILADEINRATPKTQSALLEAMQEQQLTVGTRTIRLDEPYCVMATQNPVEQEGTYPLPEAQLDRFLLKLVVGYPREEEYRAILDRTTGEEPPAVEAVSTGAEIVALRSVVRAVPVPEHVQTYAIRLVIATQPGSEHAPPLVNENVSLGASPRGAQALLLAGKVKALLAGRFAVSTDDVRAVAADALRHRLMVNFQGQSEGVGPDHVVAAVLEHVAPPHGSA